MVELIRREAARYAVGIHHCELVGLIPQQALVDAAQWYLQLDQFEPEQILEHKYPAATQETSQHRAAGWGISWMPWQPAVPRRAAVQRLPMPAQQAPPWWPWSPA